MTETVNPLDDLMPGNPIMAAAWAGSLHYALTRDDVMAAFREETGNQWKPGKTPIDRMIDEATGADRDFIVAFARWHNANIWGENPDGSPMDVGMGMELKPGYYKTRDGRKAHVAYRHPDHVRAYCPLIGAIQEADGSRNEADWRLDGKYRGEFKAANDLVAEWGDEAIEGWVAVSIISSDVNQFLGGGISHTMSGLFRTRKFADEACSTKLDIVRRIRITDGRIIDVTDELP